MNCPQDWPEPIIRVQSLSDSGIPIIPDRFIKPPPDRPVTNTAVNEVNIPLIDLKGLFGDDSSLKATTLDQISQACREWGFFQVINHGVSPRLMDLARDVWRDFFHQPMEEKQAYANSPRTYEGYGSRLGGVIGCREVMDEYGEELLKLCGRLMKVLSINLGLGEEDLQNAFGGNNIGTCLRVNFYPKCPQPDLTLGLSSHSDPGGMTLLLPDAQVPGLQVRRNNNWITVKPAPHAFIVNIGDQIQVLSNAVYKSVEHRVIVNSGNERVSLAFFYNPKSDILIQPVEDLVTPEKPA
ncbi:hypothetical protein C3L33_02901, partial [Rhododendron williamsianum]